MAAHRHLSGADLFVRDFADPARSVARPRRHRSLRVRLLARLWGSWLDSALASGVDPTVSPALERRAELVLSMRNRAKVVRSLRLGRASTGRRVELHDLRVPVDQVEVEIALPRLIELEDLLLAPGPVYCQGVVMASRIVGEGTGPLYAPRRRGELSDCVEAALAALRGAS